MNRDKRYNEIIKNELSDVKSIIKKGNNINCLYEDLKMGGNKAFYKNLIFEIEETKTFYDDKKEFVMIGCGYLPLTILAYCKRYSKSMFKGIDVDEKATKSCNKLRNMYGLCNNTMFKTIDGRKYNYINSKTILIAAMVKDKIDIINRILCTASIQSKIFIRLFYKEDHEIINKIKKSCVGLKVLFKINKNDYPIKEEYDLVVLEKSENTNQKLM